ncbi:hypothetical protein [Undibacterium terreum]|uniref:Uncharacterized protein n=1 Tax=Undibacterium terreum TaxID=1224302 RepID=A0A916UB61_9BURK|nr:hypothetical protein [Undibacterium terreum]GGC65794.1 hypothetical protein GCM10011396_11020 [Undibacterium terreum]
MLELFLAECRRFRKAALIFAAASLLISYHEFRATSFLSNEYVVYCIGIAAYLLAAGALALYQIGAYKQPARWIWLLHRAIPRWQIFVAIQFAAAALIGLAAGLPLILSLLATQAEHARVVDTRFYVDALHVVLLCILSWQSVSYAILARHRFSFVVLLFPLMLMSLYLASTYVLLLPALLSILLMGYALYTVFRPERRSMQDRPLSFAIAAIPMLLCFYIAMSWSGTILFKVGFTALGKNRPENYVPGGYLEAQDAAGDFKLLQNELAASSDPRAKSWRDQLSPSDESTLRPSVRKLSVRNQAANTDPAIMYDGKRYNWPFSHDSMRFIALNNDTGTQRELSLGPHGINDPAGFAEPVSAYYQTSRTEAGVVARTVLFSRSALYLLDSNPMRIRQIVALSGGESLASTPSFDSKGMTLITNKRVVSYVMPASTGGSAEQLPTERYSITLPGPVSDLGLVNTAEVADGTIVTLLYAGDLQHGAGNSQAITYHVQNGQASVINRRALVDELGVFLAHREYWMSPALFSLLEVPDMLLDRGRVLDAGQATDSTHFFMPRPRDAQIIALLAMLISGVAAWLWLQRTACSTWQRAVWIAACLMLGLPGLFVLLAQQQRLPFAGKLSDLPGAQMA